MANANGENVPVEPTESLLAATNQSTNELLVSNQTVGQIPMSAEAARSVWRERDPATNQVLVPYQIMHGMEQKKQKIQKAIAKFNRYEKVPVRFVDWNEQPFASARKDKSYLIFVDNCDEPTRVDHVGKHDYVNAVRIGNDFKVHTVLHELGHVLGLLHEHQRIDRPPEVTPVPHDPNQLRVGP